VSADGFRILPEGTLTESIVNDAHFTEITDDGEIYVLYRIVKFTHFTDSPHLNWTHRANVVGVRKPNMGVALLRVVDRTIEDSHVTSTYEQE
jgi:hypothetical protein